MKFKTKGNRPPFLLFVGIAAWLVPGGGYFVLNEKKRAAIVFVTITLTFLTGIYIASIGAIDPVGGKPWYVAQILNSPVVAVLGHLTATGKYPVYGRVLEFGQLYTSVAGLLNLLCIASSIYLGHLQIRKGIGD